MERRESSDSMKTPKSGPCVPKGTVAVNDKWHGTPLGRDIQKQQIGFFEDGKEFGVVDFFVSQSAPVIYISQSDMALGNKYYEAKLRKLINLYPISAIIVVGVRNKVTIEAYNAMVDFATLELDLDVIPIGNELELPQLLGQMAFMEVSSPSNPYRQKSKPDLPGIQRKLIEKIPGVGSKKINLLFGKFGHIEGIANASSEELSSLVGEATANNVRKFFHESIRLEPT